MRGKDLHAPAFSSENLIKLELHFFTLPFGRDNYKAQMTRRDEMLDEFDALATAELDDIAASRRNSEPVAASRPALLPELRSPARSGWDWVIGLGVLGLVILAARR